MKQMYKLGLLAMGLFLFVNFSSGQNSLIISQYIETSSGTTPKGLELWNVSGGTIDFSVTNLDIQKGGNGGSLSSVHTITSGTLADGEVMVVGTSDIGTYLSGEGLTGVLYSEKTFSFNGDDALAIILDGNTEDVFGLPGQDPGSSWTGGTVDSRNNNISLKSGITTGDTDGWTDPSERFETTADGLTLTGFGVAPAAATTNTVVQFESASATVSEGDGTYALTLTITNEDAVATGVDVKISTDVTPTADATDIGNYTTQSVSFPSSDASNQSVTITLTDDSDVEGTEVIYFELTNISGGNSAELGSEVIFELTIEDNDFLSEPTNHVSSFAAVANGSSTIDLTWSDNDGTQPAEGFLIKMSTADDIVDPSDLTAEADGTNTVNVGSGVEAYSWTGLDSETQYFFQIYPYTNSDVNIDYKTDGTIPSDNATTEVFVVPEVFITEIADPGNNAGARYIELYNAGETVVDLTGWEINIYFNANSSASGLNTLSGTIPAGGFFILADNNTNFNSAFGFDADQDGSVNSNGDDNFELLDASGNLIDLFGVPGEDGTGTDHDFVDGRAERKAEITIGNTTYDAAEWNVNTSSDAPDGFDPGDWIGVPDLDAPVFTVGPTSTNVSGNGADFNVELDEAGTVYYVLIDDPDGVGGTEPSTPTPAQVKAGQDASSGSVSLSGSVVVADADTSNPFTITGLAGSTYYYLFVVAEDAVPNIQSTTTIVNLTTTATDNTAPSHEDTGSDAFSPHVSNVADSQFDLTIRLDEIGTAYYVVVSDGSSPIISAAQVMAGTDQSDQPALVSGMIDITSASQNFTETIGGSLESATDYDLYVVVADDETTPNVSTPAFRNILTTSDTQAPTVLSASTDAVAVANSITLTMSESVTSTDATGFTININGSPATISDFGVSVDEIGFLINESIFAGDVVTIDYNDTEGDVADLAANALASFTDQAVTNNATTVLVDDIATLRAGTTDGTVYRLGTEVVLLYQQSSRNQKYIQDSNGDGILIDDSSGNLSTTYAIGDGISNIEGTLSVHNNILQFVPTGDAGAATSSGNSFVSTTVTIDDFNTNFSDYQSQYLKFETVSFADAGTTFDVGADNYTVTDGVNNLTYRDNLSEARVDAGTVPYGRVDVYGIAGEFSSAGQVYPISTTISDFAVDIYEPQFTVAAAMGNETIEGGDITFQSDEPGTIYYLVVADEASEPSVGEVMAGTASAYMNVGTDNTITISGLSDNTAYDVYVLLSDGTNDGDTPVKLDLTTLEIVFDATSDITAPVSQIGSTTISSISDTEAEAVEVFAFTISDEGTDGEPTLVTGMQIESNDGNSVDWTAALGGAYLNDGTSSYPLTIGADVLTIDLSSSPFELANGTSQEFSLHIWLNSVIEDGSSLEFTIPTGHSFTADPSGSVFLPSVVSRVAGSVHTIDVVATGFDVDVSSTVPIAENFTLSATAVDANGNIDTDARTVTLSKTAGDGAFSGTNLSAQAMTDGYYEWTDLQFAEAGSYTLTVDDDGSALTESVLVAGAEITGTMFISEYIEGSGSSKAIEIYNGTGAIADLTEYSVDLYNDDGETTVANTLALSDIAETLGAGEVLVIANSGADAAILAEADITSSVTFYGGDNPIALVRNGEIIDLFGEIGVDPAGSGWDVAGVSEATTEQTLVRKGSVTQGNTTPLASFGTTTEDSEWIVYSQNDFNFIGFHAVDGELFPLVTIDQSSFDGSFGFVAFGNQSDVSSYTVTAADLTTDLTITPPAGFELSATAAFDGTIYTNASAWAITPVDGEVSQEVFVRFNPTVADGAVYTGDISHESDGADTKTLGVSGQEGVLSNDLFFSEYTESNGGNNKLIEIYNNLGATADLTQYSVGLYFNGGTSAGNTLVLSDIASTLEDGGVLVIANASADPELLNVSDITSDVTFYNGDDALALLKNGIVIDVIGEIGSRPDPAWDVAGVSGATADHTLIRKPTISQGNPVNLASFGTNAEDSEWIVLDFSDNSDLGSHSTEQEGDPIITVSSTIDTNFGIVQVGATVEQTYSVSAVDLLGDLTISAPSGFMVSTDGSTFASSVSLTPTDGTVGSTTITVQFSPDAEGEFDGSISHESTDALTKTLSVAGTAVGEEVLYFENFASCDALNTMTSQSVSGDEVWECTPNGETGGGVRMNGFSGGSAQDNLDWLITPSIDLSEVDAAELTFDSDVRYDGPEMEVYISVDFSGDADAATWTKLTATFDQDADNFDTWTPSGNVDISAFAGSSVHIGFLYSSSAGSGAATWSLDNVKVIKLEPFFEVTSDTFNGEFGSENAGSSSAATSFTLDGYALTDNDVTITPPVEFEVSTTADFSENIGTASTPLALDITDGRLEDVMIYVRFSPSNAGSFSGNIAILTDGYSQVDLPVTGTGLAVFEVIDEGFQGAYGALSVGANSIAQSFTINGFALTGDVTVTPPAQFEVSTSSDFSSNVGTSTSALTITATEGTVDGVEVFVRFSPSEAGTFSGDVTVSTTGYDDVTLAVSGTGTADDPVLGLSDLQVEVYPNPTSSSFTISNDGNQKLKVKLFGIDGTVMKTKKTGNQYDISHLSSGLYILKISNNQGEEMTRRILKQ